MKTTVKQTKIQRQAEVYASSQAYIQKAVPLTDLEYKTAVYESGIVFLQHHWDGVCLSKNIEVKRIDHYSRKTSFWTWWQIVFSQWATEFMNICEENGWFLTEEMWQQELLAMPVDPVFHMSFEHFEKLTYEKRIDI